MPGKSVRREACILGDDACLVGEASTLGLRTGEWPAQLIVVDGTGDGVIFERGEADYTSEGELAGYKYVTKHGNELLVIND